MAKILTKAERYKRNYRLIRNMYNDSKLAKQYQTKSDADLEKLLAVRITKTIPDLKPIKKDKKSITYYNRKFDKIQYALQQKIDPALARKLTAYKKGKIKSTGYYVKEIVKNDSPERRKKRAEWFKKMSKEGNLPPIISKRAKERNQKTLTYDQTRLEEYAHYGFTFEFFRFVEFLDFEDEEYIEEYIDNIMKPDAFMDVVNYAQEKIKGVKL